jgi:polyhydroxybutyrate depolymerase
MSFRRTLLVVLLAAALILPLGVLALRPSAHATAVVDGCAARPGTTVRVHIDVPGQGVRSALVHVPRKRGRGAIPLVLALHGGSGTGAFMERYSGLSRIADRKGFGVVYPDATGPLWHISAGDSADDVEFLDALLDQTLAGGCFDAQRVSAVGVSNGAGMAVRLACTGDDRLAGLVAVAGSYGHLPACLAHKPLSVLEIHGTADPVVPYHGSPPDRRGDVLRWVRGWAAHDGCRAVPRRTNPRRDVLRLDWSGCNDGTAVAHLQLVGGEHAWPGADPPDDGPQLVSASDEAWAFLRDRRLPASVRQHDDG